MGTHNTHDYFFPLLTRNGALQGTAFLVSAEGHFMTAGHVMRAATEGGSGLAMAHRPGTDRYKAVEYEVLAHHKSADVSFGRLLDLDWDCRSFPILSRDLPLGEDVYAFGFVPPTGWTGGHYSESCRYAKGYVEMALPVGNLATPSKAYEVSFEVPPGMSGAALMTYHHEPCVGGVLVGSGRTEFVDDIVRDTETSSDGATSTAPTVYKRVLPHGVAATAAAILGIPEALAVVRVLG